MKLLSEIGETYLKETECVGISASPDTLREIAKFLMVAADELEDMGEDFSHLHLMDEWSGWSEGTPDIQVFNDKI
jgi:hypothetical protein